MVTVTAVYERDAQGRWLVHIAEEPRCHTWARSYGSARREILDAAELWLDELHVESLDHLDIRDEVRIASMRAGQRQSRRLSGVEACLHDRNGSGGYLVVHDRHRCQDPVRGRQSS